MSMTTWRSSNDFFNRMDVGDGPETTIFATAASMRQRYNSQMRDYYQHLNDIMITPANLANMASMSLSNWEQIDKMWMEKEGLKIVYNETENPAKKDEQQINEKTASEVEEAIVYSEVEHELKYLQTLTKK